ncbi:hypothetical protein F7725_012296 [Dissostichus mawsoni]|uniref:Condensin complex subunit 2 n=1 Tax=Dissostichus mawsoni TaxID=36200 RepID=A0A7J5YLY7_DISMA|nr:hypothetical protein F7725_012296 [Dissostichus mawsoni]
MRLVHDAMAGHTDGALPKDLKQHCRGARTRYEMYLEDQKKLREQTTKEKKRKELSQEIQKVKTKRQKVMTSAETMEKEAHEMAVMAEKKHDFTLLSKSNAYRKGVADKKEEVAALDKALKELQESRSKERTSICPSLQDFSFTSWDPEQTMNQLLEKMQQGDHVFDVNAEPEPEEDDGPDFDADYDDADCEERGKEFKEGCEASGSGRGRDVIPIGEGDIATCVCSCPLSPESIPTSAPEPWPPGPGPVDHMPDKEPPKRKPKKMVEIDFNDDVNFDAFFRTTRAATTISKSALSVSNKKTTLPADFQFPPESLSQLNLKPSSSLTQEGQKRLSGELGEGIGDYDYNNANDTANFCPGLQGGDSDDDAEGFADDPSAESLPPPSLEDITTYGEQDLVPEPHRRLKNGMWSLLTESPDKPSQETDAVEKTEVFGEKAFSQTTKILLQRLPNTMAQNLSVPLAFVALLHLANEKNLELVKVEDMSDIIIRQGH